jgi:hypothetical protein
MARFKDKYEALNYLNEKYEVYYCEIAEHEDARMFWRLFCCLWEMNKVEEEDIDLGEDAMDMF